MAAQGRNQGQGQDNLSPHFCFGEGPVDDDEVTVVEVAVARLVVEGWRAALAAVGRINDADLDTLAAEPGDATGLVSARLPILRFNTADDGDLACCCGVVEEGEGA